MKYTRRPMKYTQHRQAIERVWTDVRSFDFKWIIPYETAFSAAIWKKVSTWVMLLFAFTPLLAFSIMNSLDQVLIFLVAYFAAAWAAYFYLFVANRSTNLRIGLGTAAFTMCIGVPLVLLLKHTPPLSLLYGMTRGRFAAERLAGYIFGVGINEEVLKAVPVMLLAFRLRRIERPIDGIFYGALSGLGFAVPEGFKYIGHAGTAGAILAQTLIRTTTLPFLHATYTAITGYFIALAVVNRHRRVALCMLGIAVSAVLHGTYDFTCGIDGSLTPVGVAAFVYVLFIAYMDRSQEMLRELEQAETLAAAASASFPIPEAVASPVRDHAAGSGVVG